MFKKLAFNNAKKSAKDYILFIFSMTLIGSLLYAFNALIFDPTTTSSVMEEQTFTALIGLADFFILLISAWLVQYMIFFMMKMRSREFAIYGLIGISSKKIARIFVIENAFLGLISFFISIPFGTLFQFILKKAFFIFTHKNIGGGFSFQLPAIFFTFGLYAFIYLIALFRSKRKLKKISIQKLLLTDSENEKPKIKKHIFISFCLFFISIIFFIYFFLSLFNYKMTTMIHIFIYIIGLVIAIYFFYSGISGGLSFYTKVKGRLFFKNNNIFVFKQLSSKITAIQKTLGTVTSFITLGILALSLSILFNLIALKKIDYTYPFDLIIYNQNPNYSFDEYFNIIEKEISITEKLKHTIYTDNKNNVIKFLQKEVKDLFNIEEKKQYKFNTFLLLSDYNKIRKSLDLKAVELKKDEYIIHCKKRFLNIFAKFDSNQKIEINGKYLNFKEIYTEGISQNGHHGSDFILVVDDSYKHKLRPFYSIATVKLNNKISDELLQSLNKIDKTKGKGYRPGNDNIMTLGDKYIISRNYIFTHIMPIAIMLSFILFYIASIFMFVVLTVLSIQQLSDAKKDKHRYKILFQLGFSSDEIKKVILKQLRIYFYLPAVIGIVLSGLISTFTGKFFYIHTGFLPSGYIHFILSLIPFFIIYGIYFLITYKTFIKNTAYENC